MEEKTLNTKKIYKGRLVDFEVLDVELPDGSTSVREVVRHPGAIAALALRDDGHFLFVRQYRKPVEQIMTEVVAGTLDPGEDPVLCAARELKEETGYEPVRLVHLGHIFPTPGYVSERIEVFFAEVAGDPGDTALDEDENVQLYPLTEEQFLTEVRAGNIPDAKTLAVWNLYQQKKSAF